MNGAVSVHFSVKRSEIRNSWSSSSSLSISMHNAAFSTWTDSGIRLFLHQWHSQLRMRSARDYESLFLPRSFSFLKLNYNIFPSPTALWWHFATSVLHAPNARLSLFLSSSTVSCVLIRECKLLFDVFVG